MKLQEDTLLLNIRLGNAAFEENTHSEIARILRDCADRIESDNSNSINWFHSLRDANGNIVGEFAIKPKGYET